MSGFAPRGRNRMSGGLSHAQQSGLPADMVNAGIDATKRGPEITAIGPTTTEARVRRDRDSRRPQRRGFDDDNYVPPPNFGYAPRESRARFEPAPASGPVSATVKWYNPEKGFGFVQLPTGGDAFLHVSVVERSGNSSVPPGATLEVRVG